MKDQYYKTLTRAGLIVDKAIEAFLSGNIFGKAKAVMYQPMLSRKKGKQKLRAGMLYILYLLLSNSKQEDEIPANIINFMASVELAIYAEYQANWIFDNKGLVRSDPLIRKKTAVSTKSFLEDAIRFAELGKQGSGSIILDASKNVTLGFAYELEMDMSNKSVLGMGWLQFNKKYIDEYAVYAVGETFAHALDFVIEYLGLENLSKIQIIKVKKLREIILTFGAYMEMLNDLGDFSYKIQTNDKSPLDQFSDIRNGAITPVIWHMYNNAGKNDQLFLYGCYGKSQLLESEKERLANLLFKNGTYDFISKILKSKSRKLKKEFKKLDFDKNEGHKLFQILLSILESNKIFHFLELEKLEMF